MDSSQEKQIRLSQIRIVCNNYMITTLEWTLRT